MTEQHPSSVLVSLLVQAMNTGTSSQHILSYAGRIEL